VTDLGTLDTLVNNFTSAIAGTWGPQLFLYLQPVLLGIIVLQFGLVAVEATVQRDIPLLLSHTMMGLFRIGIVWSIYTYGFTWANSVVQTGQTLGNDISGFGMTASGVFDTGLSCMKTIFAAKATGAWYLEGFEKLEFFAVGLAVMLCWAAASIIYAGALIEASLLVYVAPLIVAFTPLSWTFEMLLIWARSLLAIAFKTALILMTLAVGMALSSNWIANFTATAPTFSTDIWNLLIGVVEAIIFAYCVWRIPNKISGLTAGAATIGFGEAALGFAGGRASAAYSSLTGGSGNGGSSGGGNSSGGSNSNGGNGGAGSSGGGTANSAGQATQQLAAKVQATLTQG
jgi:uncharacterized membrane protein YgcG